MVDKRRHTEVLREALAVEGRRVVDIGCGRGGLAGWLQRQGAQVIGVDAQAAAVRAARASGVPAVVARADALPLAGGSVDVAIIFNSLHDFPAPAAALVEARRVLAADGALYVAEPLAEGAHFDFMQPVDDETEVRAAAMAALDRAAQAGFALSRRRDYAYDVIVADVDDAVRGWLAVDPSRAARIAALRPELARRLADHGAVTAAGYALEQPMRSWVLRPV